MYLRWAANRADGLYPTRNSAKPGLGYGSKFDARWQLGDSRGCRFDLHSFSDEMRRDDSIVRTLLTPFASLLATVTCVALVGPSVALAQVRKCLVDGRTVYTDVPCTSGEPIAVIKNKSMQASSTQTTSSPSTGIDSKVIWNRYPVRGQDYASLVKSLAVNGPKGFHGLASWNVVYQYTTRITGNACRFDSIKLIVKGEILMPKWTDEDTAPPALRQRWADYYSALQQHEEGHLQHGNELASLVQEKFLGYGDFACDQANTVAKSEFDKLYTNLKNRDKEYDMRTQHGATQGARF
jgi:predicted secreted Zn-dependent protease